MILLDTNVISALMRDPPDAAVRDWLDAQDPAEIRTTAITALEVAYGVLIMPAGVRRNTLVARASQLFGVLLAGRVEPFDAGAAHRAAELAAKRRAAGIAVEIRDTQTAGIAPSRRAVIATRDLRHSADLDPPAISPWEA